VRSTIGCGPQVQPDISCCRRSTTNYCVRHTSHLFLTNEFRCTGYDIRGQNNCKHSVVSGNCPKSEFVKKDAVIAKLSLPIPTYIGTAIICGSHHTAPRAPLAPQLVSRHSPVLEGNGGEPEATPPAGTWCVYNNN
jgi:hypothetical protein